LLRKDINREVLTLEISSLESTAFGESDLIRGMTSPEGNNLVVLLLSQCI
jgi:hypothetical protein